MIPTIVIGDVHGLAYWKEIVNKNPSCRSVFLGDYLDPYENIPAQKLIDNLNEIIRLKEERPDDVILLLGNHDLHYFTTDIDQGTRFNSSIAKEVSILFLENIELFQYAFQEENYIFTHAGISEKWFLYDFKGDTKKNIAEQLNDPLQEQIPALCRCGEERGGEQGATGGIFWADIRELYNPLPGFTQIVGHNRVRDIYDHSNNGGRIVFCDCLWNKLYLKL